MMICLNKGIFNKVIDVTFYTFLNLLQPTGSPRHLARGFLFSQMTSSGLYLIGYIFNLVFYILNYLFILIKRQNHEDHEEWNLINCVT